MHSEPANVYFMSATEVKAQIEHLLQRGQKLDAIQLIRKRYGVSLSDAQKLIDALENERSGKGGYAYRTSTLTESQRAHVQELIRGGDTLGAVRWVRDQTGSNLAEALTTVGEITSATGIPVGTGAHQTVFKVAMNSFKLIGLILLGITGYIVTGQVQTITNGERITGTVIDLDYDEGGSAPVIAYEWEGKTLKYWSSTRSNPPSYTQGEQVPLYVHRERPESVVVDTFTDRWLWPVVLGLMGLMFFGIPTLASKLFSTTVATARLL